ncbi:MAG: mechanosensitive ion channel family protein [Alphaproteobacteria bacterium]|nr:mechanosensitive ion channel family protein [Alphaproteobacteria bacterium]
MLLLVADTSAHAQTLEMVEGEESETVIVLPDPLTQEAIRDLLSQIDDQKVREILLQRLSEEADRRARELAALDQRDLDDIAEDYAMSLGAFVVTTIEVAPNIPSSISKAMSNFATERGDRGYGVLFLALIVSMALGLAAGILVRRATKDWQRPAREGWVSPFWSKLGVVSLQLASQVLSILAFAVVALGINLIWNESAAADQETLRRFITACIWTWMAAAVAIFMLSPRKPELRLCTADDKMAHSLIRFAVIVAAVFNFGFGFVVWMNHMGVPYGEVRFGFWVNLAFHIAIAAAIWINRNEIRTILMGHIDQAHRVDRWFSKWWPQISIGLLVLHLLVSVLIASTGTVDRSLLTAMALTLSILIGLPLIDQSVSALARGLISDRPDKDPAIQAADEQTRIGLSRVCRVVVLTFGVFFLLHLWGFDIVTLAEEGIGAQFARSVIDIFLIIVLTYGLWELIQIVTNRQIAMEKIALGVDDGEAAEGEGGGAGARLGTILPLAQLVAQITLLSMAVLAVLGEMGVNVLPLLAGAGVVGLAVGFGAQALVKDIVSGIFFLIDDAFRKGEYVDIGSVKGTVERISIRSMQLRHHRGPLNTVPFGDIGHVTNFSRDWAIMKLPLRLTYDTDTEKVRKMIKKLGQELLLDPEVGPQFLEPLKSQGVVQMEDSAQIMSLKFMTRPGDQWMLRRVIFAKIRELFEKNGIRFANREVTVRLSDEDNARTLSDQDRQTIAGSAARIVTKPDEPAR